MTTGMQPHHHRVLRFGSAICSALLLSTSLAPAATSTTTVPVQPISVAGEYQTGTLFPKFDAMWVNATLVNTLRGRANDTRPLLGWGRCQQPNGDGTFGTLSFEHCVRFTVGTSQTQTTYVLLDTRCTPGSSAAACYAGYVIGSLAATAIDTTAVGSTSFVAIDTTIRLGSRRMARLTLGAPLTPVFSLPPTPELTVHTEMELAPSSQRTQVVAIAADGRTIVDQTQLVIASQTGLTCTQIAELARAAIKAGGDVGALLTFVGVSTVGIGAGIFVAAGGTGATLGAGTGPAITAGVGIASVSVAVGVGLALAIREVGDSSADLIAQIVQIACERQAAIDDFDPEDLPTIDTSPGGSGAHNTLDTDAVSCNGEQEGDATIDGQTCYVSCAQYWAASGECKWACAVGVCE